MRRDLSGLLAAPGYALQAYNSTGGYWYYHSDRTIIREILHKAHLKRSLDKRAFDKLSGRVTAQKVDDYVKNQLVGKPEPQFPNKPEGFFSGDMNTVSLLGQFGTDTIQFGTNQLHGCTMLTVISNRAVYMVIFNKTYAPTHSSRRADPFLLSRLTTGRLIRRVATTTSRALTWPFGSSECSMRYTALRSTIQQIPLTLNSPTFPPRAPACKCKHDPLEPFLTC